MAQMNDPLLSSVRSTPKDAQVMAAILKEMGITDYEPRILNQMLEFTYRYVSNVIEDAQLYSSHAKKKNIDSADISLAISLQEDRNFTHAPNRELTVEMAKQRNKMSLPLIKTSAGLRLPPDRYSLTACNYKLKSSKKARTVHTVSRLNILPSNSANKSTAPSFNKTGPITSIITKATPIIPKPVINVAKPVTAPLIKFTDGNRVITPISVSSPIPTVISTSASNLGSVSLMLPTVGNMNMDSPLMPESISVKRKLEDDNYD